MIVNAALYTAPGSELSGDICIVGSGAAALSMAHNLISSGRRIVILESSYANTDSRVPRCDNRDVFRTGVAPNDALHDGVVCHLMTSLAPQFLTATRRRCYGGSTNCWGGWTRPLDADDFDRNDLDPIATWPIGRDDLLDFYNLAIQYCSLGTWDVSKYDDLRYWAERASRSIEPLYFESPSLRAGILAVINRTGLAGGRLAFQLAWGGLVEEATNVTILRGAHTRYLEPTTAGHSVYRVLASTLSSDGRGHDFYVKADNYVIAAGGIETTRLLLASDGVGNRHDQLGRYFMLHPVNDHAATFTPGAKLGEAVRNYCFGTTTLVGKWPPTLFAIAMPTPEAMKAHAIGNCRVQLNRHNQVNFTWEQLPNRDSRIRLASSRDPIFGDPLVNVEWKTTDTDMRTLFIGLPLIMSELEACGYVTDVATNLSIAGVGDHHMGATRMSLHPTDGVVDRNCRVHGLDNLYVASSSVFATGGFANPTLTIIALALRLANQLATT